MITICGLLYQTINSNRSINGLSVRLGVTNTRICQTKTDSVERHLYDRMQTRRFYP